MVGFVAGFCVPFNVLKTLGVVPAKSWMLKFFTDYRFR